MIRKRIVLIGLVSLLFYSIQILAQYPDFYKNPAAVEIPEMVSGVGMANSPENAFYVALFDVATKIQAQVSFDESFSSIDNEYTDGYSSTSQNIINQTFLNFTVRGLTKMIIEEDQENNIVDEFYSSAIEVVFSKSEESTYMGRYSITEEKGENEEYITDYSGETKWSNLQFSDILAFIRENDSIDYYESEGYIENEKYVYFALVRVDEKVFETKD